MDKDAKRAHGQGWPLSMHHDQTLILLNLSVDEIRADIAAYEAELSRIPPQSNNWDHVTTSSIFTVLLGERRAMLAWLSQAEQVDRDRGAA